MKQGIFHFVDEEKRPNKFYIYRDLEVVELYTKNKLS
jgi:hypothetical protein